MNIFHNPAEAFEKAAKAFLRNPSQQTYQKYINEFANAIFNKVEVQAMIIMENIPEFGGPCMRLNRMTIGGKDYFSFYTNSRLIKSSPFDSDFANMTLDMVAELTIGDESIAGLIVNPSNGSDASISSETIRKCYEAAKAHKSN